MGEFDVGSRATSEVWPVEIRKIRPGWLWITEHELGATMSFRQLASILRVTPHSIDRWLRQRRIPPLVASHIRVVVLGRLPHPRWRGWRLGDDGKLWSPADQGFFPAEIENLGLYRDTNRMLYRALRARDQQPRPRLAAVRRFNDDAE